MGSLELDAIWVPASPGVMRLPLASRAFLGQHPPFFPIRTCEIPFIVVVFSVLRILLLSQPSVPSPETPSAIFSP